MKPTHNDPSLPPSSPQTPQEPTPKPPQHLGQLRRCIHWLGQGGWIIALLLVLTAGALIKDVIIPIMQGHIVHIVGDGKHVSSYGFNLQPLLVPRQELIASGQCKNFLVALRQPKVLDVAEVSAINRRLRDSGGFVVAASRVIGVVINGQARAYPLQMLNWHGIANDTLGGDPIAVIYDGPCDSSLVASRVIDGKKLRFAESGLVYNSNALIYDHQQQAKNESLWTSIGGRAISGPAAANHLTLHAMPCCVVPWGVWRKLHPNTTMIAGDPALYDAYRKDPYGAYYFESGLLRYPVNPRWDRSIYRLKEPLLLLKLNGHWRPVAFADLLAHAPPRDNPLAGRNGTLTVAGKRITYRCWVYPQSTTAMVLSPEHTPTTYCLLFAWYAQHPNEFAGAHWGVATTP
ncbi:MAG: DUF3179 domain-containing protein [Phycisphaerales bacterium]|nr:DUF3179 domain-containing protein [Phycisphaerales bacterium]